MINRRKQHGVASIEFGLGFMAFFLMIMLWAEMGYLAYVSSANDLAIAEASRRAKTTNTMASRSSQQTQFMTEFKRIIREQAGVLGNIIDPDKYRLTVHYFASIEELGRYGGSNDDTCTQNENHSEVECGNPTDSALAIYRVNYDYTPMLAIFMRGSSSLTREVVVIQEFERDQFKI
ncbi:TadE/TadG family type IV pilus assembly protein [Vibrio sp. VPAP30]|uniref:TadE/TadG family type IV pilus assembly protein n=1 Tax=Vibrio sp. VPAP30 TaxID=1647102 RepID=UPI00065845FD|nr:TadE family protein [Vibrio sp. VPAP30]KLN63257.1 pilus assembly protein TadE [Vibrio sp. VPAP30]